MDSDGLYGGVQMLLTQSLLCGLFGPFYHAVSLKSTLHSVLNYFSALMKMDAYNLIATLHIVPIIHFICYMFGTWLCTPPRRVLH